MFTLQNFRSRPNRGPDRYFKIQLIIVWLTALFVGSIPAQADQRVAFSSGPHKVDLIELYTSQGCSSCPPAENWLGGLVSDPRLWKRFVPIGLHVDYWDHLGWQDSYARREFSDRQRRYNDLHRISRIYTPEFVVSGREWDGWFDNDKMIPLSAGMAAGILIGEYQSGRLEVAYAGANNDLELHVALLGFDVQTGVTAGENRNRVLKQDFIVLVHQKYGPANGNWSVQAPQAAGKIIERYALAIWVSKIDDPTPIQAAGAWLSMAPCAGGHC